MDANKPKFDLGDIIQRSNSNSWVIQTPDTRNDDKYLTMDLVISGRSYKGDVAFHLPECLPKNRIVIEREFQKVDNCNIPPTFDTDNTNEIYKFIVYGDLKKYIILD